MNALKQLLLATCIFTLLFMLAPSAGATVWDQRVIATFSGPVQIPGQVLPTGTYVFKVVDVVGTRDIVQVTNADESQVLATAFTVTRYRAYPTDKPVFEFSERGTNSPQALQAWFYPGYTGGHQFIYTNAEEMAVNNIPAPVAPATTTNSSNATEESSPVMSAEADTNEPAPAAEPESTQNQTAPVQSMPDTSAPTSTDQADKELPKTASATPLIALIGILLLGGAFGLKMFASRVS